MHSTTLTSVLLAAVAVSASPTQTLSDMLSSPLIQSEVNQFTGCVKASNVEYNAGVDKSGYIVISPVGSRAIDLGGQDQGLYNCMSQASETLKTAAESTLYGLSNDGDYVPLAAADFAYLSSKGAEGLKRQAPTPTNVERAPAANTQYFNFYRDDDKGCGSTDLLHSNLKTCNTYMSSWASSQWENVSGSQKLKVTIWPHHDCTKGNDKSYVQAENSRSSCHDRTTYSYKGTYE